MLCLKQERFVFHQWITPEETWFSLSEQVLLVFSLTTNWKSSDIFQNFIIWSSESSFSYPRYMQKWSYRAKFWWTSKGTFHRKRSIDVTVLWLFCFLNFCAVLRSKIIIVFGDILHLQVVQSSANADIRLWKKCCIMRSYSQRFFLDDDDEVSLFLH